MSFYRLYGLDINSSVLVPGLEPTLRSTRTPDLYLASGAEPEWVKSARELPGRVLRCRKSEETGDSLFVLTEYGQSAYFDFSYSDGARFFLDLPGTRVWGTCEPPLNLEDFASYFLGPVMGFLLRQRNIISLHASAVEMLGRAVAFAGHPGFGKSTTAAALALRGRPVLSEDIVPLEQEEGFFQAIPGYPRIGLWPDAVEKLLGHRDALPKLSPSWEKRYLALDGQPAKFASEKRPLGLIYVFGARSTADNAPRIEEMSCNEAFVELVQNTYANSILDRQQRAEEFDLLARLVKQVPVRRLISHRDGGRIADLCDLIIADAGKTMGNPTVPKPAPEQNERLTARWSI